jgi:hypothetical protein
VVADSQPLDEERQSKKPDPHPHQCHADPAALVTSIAGQSEHYVEPSVFHAVRLSPFLVFTVRDKNFYTQPESFESFDSVTVVNNITG